MRSEFSRLLLLLYIHQFTDSQSFPHLQHPITCPLTAYSVYVESRAEREGRCMRPAMHWLLHCCIAAAATTRRQLPKFRFCRYLLKYLLALSSCLRTGKKKTRVIGYGTGTRYYNSTLPSEMCGVHWVSRRGHGGSTAKVSRRMLLKVGSQMFVHYTLHLVLLCV